MIEPTPDPANADAELDAMRDIAKILATLEPPQRRRVIGWVWNFAGPTYRTAADYITKSTS